MPHWKVSLMYAIIQLCFGVLAILAYQSCQILRFAQNDSHGDADWNNLVRFCFAKRDDELEEAALRIGRLA